jgi:hypothetical protein
MEKNYVWYVYSMSLTKRAGADPYPLVRGAEPDPYQNFTNPEH